MELIVSLLIANCKPGTDVDALARNIQVVSEQAGVDPALTAAVIIVESRCDHRAYNPATDDAGLMQINTVHALPDSCLFDIMCNLQAGVSILANTRRPCEYNVGRNGVRRKITKCLQYERKLNTLLTRGDQ